MGIIQAFIEWKETRYEQKIEKMRNLGICPDCRGKGFDFMNINDFVYIAPADYQCYGCNGSGSFSDWEKLS